jgi:uncharacterized protein (TIGR02597 family)
MKKTSLLVASALLASSALFAQDSVTSNVVGYITLTINGGDGSNPGYSTVSGAMQKPALTSGTITADATSAVLVDSSASNSASAYASSDPNGSSSYYLQVTSGSSAGLIVDILDNGTDSFTTASDLSSLVSQGDTYEVRAHMTLADIFGSDNAVGFTSGGGVSSSDVFYLMSTDGNASYTQYYYQTDALGFLGGNGWRAAGNAFTDMSDVVVAPDDGLIVKRTTAGNLSVVVSGNVSSADHLRGLPNGFSLVAYPYPVDVTLADSGIYAPGNGYVSGGSASASDIVYVMAADGSFTSYYYQTDALGFLGGNGWRQAGNAFASQDSAVIPAGSSVIIKHTGSGLNWADAVPYALN